jgi:fatty-acyl-CoA synthase
MGVLGCVTHGTAMIFPGEVFEPHAVLEDVQAERCTALYGVPTMFIAELGLPEFADFDLSTLRTGVMAGAPCPVEVMKRVQAEMHMTEVTICYGMTETSPVSFQSHVDDPLDKRVATVGRIHPHVQVKIVDPVTGEEVPRGVQGELCTRGYHVMKGYYKNPEATREAIDKDNWLHTGDLAVMDENGYCKITGRIKDMIIRGGENIYPREIEEFLYTHPKVKDVQVVGVPSIKYGEEVVAYIQLKPGETATDEEMRTFCKERIAFHKIPAFFMFVDEYPTTASGKIQKYKLRELATQKLGREDAVVETA